MVRWVLFLLCAGCGEYVSADGYWESISNDGFVEMAKNNPPSEFSVGGGAVWGTNVDHATSPTSETGDSVVHFTNATPASDPYLKSKIFPCEGGRAYRVWAIAQADSTTASNHVFVGIRWMTSAEATISDVKAFDAAVDTVSTWQRIGGVLTAPSNARFMRLFCGKDNTAFNAYFDYVNFEQLPYACLVRLTSGDTMSSGSYKQVNFDTEDYDYGDIYDNATNYQVTIPRTGLWTISARVRLSNILDAKYARVVLYKNSAIWLDGSFIHTGVDNLAVGVVIPGVRVYLDEGDTIEVFIIASDAGNIDAHATQYYTYLSVAEG